MKGKVDVVQGDNRARRRSDRNGFDRREAGIFSSLADQFPKREQASLPPIFRRLFLPGIVTEWKPFFAGSQKIALMVHQHGASTLGSNVNSNEARDRKSTRLNSSH